MYWLMCRVDLIAIVRNIILTFLLAFLKSIDFGCALSIRISSDTKLLDARGMRSTRGVCAELCPSGAQGCASEDYICQIVMCYQRRE